MSRGCASSILALMAFYRTRRVSKGKPAISLHHGVGEAEVHTSLACAAASALSAFSRLSLCCSSSGFSGFDFCGFCTGSAPASIVDIVAADGVDRSAMVKWEVESHLCYTNFWRTINPSDRRQEWIQFMIAMGMSVEALLLYLAVCGQVNYED